MISIYRRAVSPLIATLLLVLISIAAASLIYVFVTGYITGAGVQGPTAQSQIIIDAVALKINGSNVIVSGYVRNVGQQEIPKNGWSIYIYDLNGTLVGAVRSFSFDNPLMPGTVAFFNQSVTNITAITPNEYYDVKVVSPVGTFDMLRVKASSSS